MVPATALPLFEAVATVGGRALLVGGSVRDALRGEPSKDLDIEVHGLPVETLRAVLRRFGAVNEVGRSFGVLKLSFAGLDLDVSVPRRDSRVGTGHRGIQAEADPWLGEAEAARRRDLTINAIAWDPLAQVFVDPFGGREDLGAGVLRAVDPTTFGEDPLRALRVAQFAGRFGFRVDPSLAGLCASMPLAELPAERIRGEVEKLLTRGRPPSVGWEAARTMGAWAKVLPEWDACPPALDRVADEVVSGPRRLALLYAAACGMGDGAAAEAVLDRLWVHRVEGYRVREQVLFLVEHRATPVPDDPTCRRLADHGDLDLLARLRGDAELRDRAQRLGVLGGPLAPLLAGRDLTRRGIPPGPRLGELLARVREAQLDGVVASPEAATAWLVANGLIPP